MTEVEPAMPEPVTGTIAAVAPRPIGHARMATRANLAGFHLQAAICFARQAYDIELANQGRPFDNASMPIFWNASSSVVMSAAALEARINEMIKETIDSSSTSPEMREKALTLMTGKLKGKRDGESELAFKYQEIARSLGKTVDQSSLIYDSLKALVSFRNELVHFKPEWDHEIGRHKKASAMLDGKFHAMPNVVFPMSHLTYSGAKWAVDTAREFSAYFATLTGVKDQLAAPWLALELP
jgi:hypothetical protein